MKNEHDANLSLIPQTSPSWKHPSKRIASNTVSKHTYKGRGYLGALVIGLIISAPFIVETLKAL